MIEYLFMVTVVVSVLSYFAEQLEMPYNLEQVFNLYINITLLFIAAAWLSMLQPLFLAAVGIVFIGGLNE